MSRSIAVLIVESEPLFRRGLVSSLDSVPDIDPVAIAGTREEAIRAVESASPEVAIVGTNAQGVACVDFAADLRRHFPALATIVISVRETDDELFAAVRAGASAYCGRNVEEATLHDLVRRSADGEYVINEQLLNKPYVASRVLDQFRNTHPDPGSEPASQMPLTAREMEVLRRISTGLTNAEIAYVLGISAQTVKNHVTSILRKLAVHDRTQAVVMALRNGWLTIDDSGVEVIGSGSPRRVRRSTAEPGAPEAHASGSAADPER